MLRDEDGPCLRTGGGGASAWALRRHEITFSPTGFTNRVRLGLVRGLAEPQTRP